MGKLVAFYGINNIGKTTQTNKVLDRLKSNNLKAVLIKYPVYELEPTGPYLNSVLRGSLTQTISEEELQLWFCLNRFQFEPILKKKLLENEFVLLEDYIGTGIAWGITKGAEKSWLEKINKPLLKEDLAILLTGKRSFEARESRHIHEKQDILVEKCANVYLELAKDYNWETIKIQKNMNDTLELIWKVIFE